MRVAEVRMKAALVTLVALLTASACGSASRVSNETPNDAIDAAVDGAVDAAPTDAPPGEPDDASDFVTPRCAGASYVTAPSGAPCVVERIEHAKGLEGTCHGPPAGDTCDRFDVTVASGEVGAVPSGFVCAAAEGALVTCRWTFTGDASFGTLDDAALEAACAATVAAPSARVRCTDFGS
jgi:hypothetical protein